MHLQDVDELYQAGWRPAKETAPWGQSLPVAPQPAASTASAPPKKVACKSHPATSPLLPLLNPSQQPTNLPVPIDRLVPSAVRRHPFSNARTKEGLPLAPVPTPHHGAVLMDMATTIPMVPEEATFSVTLQMLPPANNAMCPVRRRRILGRPLPGTRSLGRRGKRKTRPVARVIDRGLQAGRPPKARNARELVEEESGIISAGAAIFMWPLLDYCMSTSPQLRLVLPSPLESPLQLRAGTPRHWTRYRRRSGI